MADVRMTAEAYASESIIINAEMQRCISILDNHAKLKDRLASPFADQLPLIEKTLDDLEAARQSFAQLNRTFWGM